MSKWAYSFNNQDCIGLFKTKEDAINEGISEVKAID